MFEPIQIYDKKNVYQNGIVLYICGKLKKLILSCVSSKKNSVDTIIALMIHIYIHLILQWKNYTDTYMIPAKLPTNVKHAPKLLPITKPRIAACDTISEIPACCAKFGCCKILVNKIVMGKLFNS